MNKKIKNSERNSISSATVLQSLVVNDPFSPANYIFYYKDADSISDQEYGNVLDLTIKRILEDKNLRYEYRSNRKYIDGYEVPRPIDTEIYSEGPYYSFIALDSHSYKIIKHETLKSTFGKPVYKSYKDVALMLEYIQNEQ